MTASDLSLMALGQSAETASRIGWSCGTVAAAGSDYTDAAATPLCSVVTGSAGGVILPKCDIGTVAIIRNATAGNLVIYSATSTETFYVAGSNTPANGQSTGATIAQYYTGKLYKNSATTWIVTEDIGA